MADLIKLKPRKDNEEAKDTDWVFVAFITLRDGRRIYARDYGLRAFRLPKRR